MKSSRFSVALLMLAASTAATAAEQDATQKGAIPGLALEALYKADAMANVRGGLDRGARLLGNGEIMADADLDVLVGWSGARAKLHLLSVHGGAPNDLAGTIQGVDNIEVAEDRTKVYQIWVEQSFALNRASLLVGMADLNAEFYQNDASGLLIAPAFGVGSELAATGPNGPSIFPSTALAARLRVTPNDKFYAQAAIFNAKAGVLGDREGIDFKMRDGALAIAEAGITAGGKFALGYWRYTEEQPDIRLLDTSGEPRRRPAHGAYLLGEQSVLGSETSGRQLSVFTRLGIADGDTSPFRGGWQAGLIMTGVLAGRPDSQFSIGANQAYLSRKYRLNAGELGQDLGRAETGLEITYQDRVSPNLAIQPDFQYIRNPSADPSVKDAVLIGVRFILSAATN